MFNFSELSINRWCKIAGIVIGLLLASGCSTVPRFPQRASCQKAEPDGTLICQYDTNGDRKADYWAVVSPQGRKTEIRYETKENGHVVMQTVNLDAVGSHDVPNIVIALDGVPFELVQQLYDQGCFRLFYRPGRSISTFPAMTDLVFWKIFGGQQPVAYQAAHFDREKNRLVSGNEVYLSGQAADWATRLDYRCSFNWDAIAYLKPQMVFDHELQGIKSVLDQAPAGKTTMVYSVATAGLGTRGGREAILRYLRTIDQFCEQLVYERRGKVKITVLADHGQNMAGRQRVTFEEVLTAAGYRLSDHIESAKDVVSVEFGLVTYADFFTEDPAGVSKAILQDPAAELACYPAGDVIVVENLTERALVSERDGRYKYNCHYGDPLRLNPIIERLKQQGKVDAEGFIDDRALFEATAGHDYPDPLHRVWEAFYGLVKKPADLIVCIKDGYVHGSGFFNVMIGGATSTHGSLNRVNSTAFVLTMLGEPPAAMRPDEILPTLEQLKR